MKTLSKICIHPWSHLAFNPNGDIWPCCHQRNDPYVLGNMNTDNPIDVFNGEKMNRIRRLMLQDKLPDDACAKCIHFESNNVKSPRQSALTNHYAQDVLDEIKKNTNEDGSLKDVKIRYWDLRWSNLCNLSCVMCGPTWSSKWTTEINNMIKQYPDGADDRAGSIQLIKSQVRDQKVDTVPNVEWIDKHINDVEYIYFAGGEPILMQEHWYIMDKLVELKKFDVKIKYNTNMSKLEHNGKNALDYWRHWSHKDLVIEGSIDETGARAEWIRYGTDWKTTQSNIQTLVKENIKTQPIISVGCYNVLRLPELMKELYDLYYNPKVRVNMALNPVLNNEWRINVLSDKVKKRAKKQLRALEQSILDAPVSWHSQFKKIYNELDKPHSEKNARSFLRYSAIIDLNRGTNVFDAIPEMEQVNTMYNDYYTQVKEEHYELRRMEK